MSWIPLAEGRARPVLAGPDWAVVLPAARIRGLRTEDGFEIAHVPGAYRPGLLTRRDRVLLQWWREAGDARPTLRWSDGLGWRVASPADTAGEACARILHGLPPDAAPKSAHLRIAIAEIAAAIDGALRATPHPALEAR